MNIRPHDRDNHLIVALVVVCLTALSFAGTVSAADDADSLVNASGVYTLTNLHPDQENNRLYSVNYQLPFLIPVSQPRKSSPGLRPRSSVMLSITCIPFHTSLNRLAFSTRASMKSRASRSPSTKS